VFRQVSLYSTLDIKGTSCFVLTCLPFLSSHTPVCNEMLTCDVADKVVNFDDTDCSNELNHYYFVLLELSFI